MHRYEKRYGAKPSYGPSRPNNNVRRARGPKKLDTRLFVKEAADAQEESFVATTQFKDFTLVEPLQRNLDAKGYATPTHIQQEAIPHLLQGRDVVGIANTGTGKTAAFLIPLVNKIYQDRTQQALIITPTRELAMQIESELRTLAREMKMESALCIGGTNMSRQMQSLRRQPAFVIGTPGRLRDLVNRRALNLARFQNIVLDEVDRMVDIGFINDITFLVSLLSPARQSLFFSATMTPKIAEVMQGFLTDPVTISVKRQDTAGNVEQNVVRVANGSNKIDTLHDILIDEQVQKALVFGRTKWGIEKLASTLDTRGFKVASIHGNKTQSQRARALEKFRRNEVTILLATDVASRGLDIANVTHVINFDAPESYDDYVHRIGRTGRAGNKGVALTFID